MSNLLRALYFQNPLKALELIERGGLITDEEILKAMTNEYEPDALHRAMKETITGKPYEPADDAFKYKPPSDPAVATDPKTMPVPTGYRKMSPEEFALFEEITAHANATEALVKKIFANIISNIPHYKQGDGLRWASIAQTDLQKGYMALKRAVALPANF